MKKLLIISVISALCFFLITKEEEISIELDQEIVKDPIFQERTKEVSTPSPKKKVVKKVITNHPSKKIIHNKKEVKYPQTISEKDYNQFDDQGNMIISEVFVDDQAIIIHGDILVDEYENFVSKEKDKKILKLPMPLIWKDGIIPYTIEENLPNTVAVNQTISLINELKIVTFVKQTKERDYVIFKKGKNNCYSNVGRIGGEQKVLLSANCGVREILHELLHTLGLFHEQNREDRDDYLIIHWENIEERFHAQFKKIPNHFQRITKSSFDFKSIMLYPPNAFAIDQEESAMTDINDEVYPINRGRLSIGDIEKLKVIYKKTN